MNFMPITDISGNECHINLDNISVIHPSIFQEKNKPCTYNIEFVGNDNCITISEYEKQRIIQRIAEKQLAQKART